MRETRGLSDPLKLGIVGLSEGNGHPYSWAAIFNGYDKAAMAQCPFPTIPEYLVKQHYPGSFLSAARVTHVWTQDELISRDIAAASNIPHVAASLETMRDHVDAVLLARDDSETHKSIAQVFLAEGIPVFIDKPLAVTCDAARQLFAIAGDTTLFSCTALRFAPELELSAAARANLGQIRFVDAYVPKSWERYAVHVIEPLLLQFPEADTISQSEAVSIGGIRQLTVSWKSGLVTRISALGTVPSQIGYTVYGENSTVKLRFHDSFGAFRAALSRFVDVVKGTAPNIPREFTVRVVELIELGRKG